MYLAKRPDADSALLAAEIGACREAGVLTQQRAGAKIGRQVARVLPLEAGAGLPVQAAGRQAIGRLGSRPEGTRGLALQGTSIEAAGQLRLQRRAPLVAQTGVEVSGGCSIPCSLRTKSLSSL